MSWSSEFEVGSADTPQNRAALDAVLDRVVGETATDTIVLTLTPGPLRPWSSKVGGLPYFPPGSECPRGTEGHPMRLLAQINFSEMPVLAGFPAVGMLQFFLDDRDPQGMYGLDLDDPTDGGFAVIFHSQVLEDDSCVGASCTCWSDGPVWGEGGLTGVLSRQPISVSDWRFDDLWLALRQSMGTDVLPDWAGDVVHGRFPFAGGHRMGGYPAFTQDDPRYPGPGPFAGKRLDRYTTLLLQLDSDEADGVAIGWGDAGVGNFFIEPERLAALDFSRVLYNWDCS